MNEYRDRKDGQVVNKSELRAAFPNVALPAVLDRPTLEKCGYDAILSAPAPSVTIAQEAVRNGVVMDAKGNWVHAWRVDELPADVVAQRVVVAEAAAREAAKVQRAAAVARIAVKVDGMTFDGDEESQGRMSRAILVGDDSAIDTVMWVLANNTTAAVPLQTLKKALALAVAAQGALWPL